MQHTLVSNERLIFWAALVVSEAAVACSLRRPLLHFLRGYLFAEAAIGAILWTLSRTIAAWPYFYCWCVGGVLDQVASAYLLFSIYREVQLRGLPERAKLPILKYAAFVSFAFGIYTSGIVRSLAQPVWKLSFSWEHAFWCAICCLVAFVPLYTWLLYSSLRGLGLTFFAFALYAVTHAGLFDLMVIKGHQGPYVWMSDGIYVVCLVLWYFAGRALSIDPKPAHSKPSEQTSVLGDES